MQRSCAVFLAVCLVIILLTISNSYTFNSRQNGRRIQCLMNSLQSTRHSRRRGTWSLYSSERDEDSQGKQRNPKSTKFDRVVDDFIGKKFGAGEAFYGKRMSDLTEEEYADRQMQRSQSESAAEYESRPMKENAVLVVGDTQPDVFAWIVLDLLEKGFTVRVICPKLKNCIDRFGRPGFNVDMIELLPDSDDQRLARAVQDCQAVIFCNIFNPIPSPLMKSASKDLTVATRVLDTIVKANAAKVGRVMKIVNISRAVPGAGNAKTSPLSVVQGTISCLLDKWLFFGEGADDVEGDAFAEFRQSHADFENVVRSSGLEYVNIRAPPVVQSARPGSVDDMAALSSEEFMELNSKIRSSSRNDEKVNSLTIGALDMAEAAVQALLLEKIEGRSFTVCARSARKRTPMSVEEMQWNEEKIALSEGERPARESYYSILALDDYTDPVQDIEQAPANMGVAEADKSELQQRVEEANAANYAKMRSSYMIRSIESVRRQLLEDEAVEQYWLELLRPIPRD